MQNKQSTLQKSRKYHRTVKKRALTSGTLIGIFLLITPYLFYLYQGFPEQATWESFFGVYESRYYESVQILAWILFGKLIPLLLLLIWFFTCKHWWYHALLVPIGMYTIQIVNTLIEDTRYIDSTEFFLVAPIVLIMAIFSYTIRMKVFDKIHGIDFSELSRGNWKGEIATPTEDVKNEDDDEDEDEPIFMHY